MNPNRVKQAEWAVQQALKIEGDLVEVGQPFLLPEIASASDRQLHLMDGPFLADKAAPQSVALLRATGSMALDAIRQFWPLVPRHGVLLTDAPADDLREMGLDPLLAPMGDKIIVK